MGLKEILRGGREKKVVTQEIYQPPYRGDSPGMPPPISIGPIQGKTDEWGVEISGRVIRRFTGTPQEIEVQKQEFLRNRFLIA